MIYTLIGLAFLALAGLFFIGHGVLGAYRDYKAGVSSIDYGEHRLDCPECSLPAEVLERHVFESTDGPIEHVKIRCINRHHFFLPTDRLEIHP